MQVSHAFSLPARIVLAREGRCGALLAICLAVGMLCAGTGRGVEPISARRPSPHVNALGPPVSALAKDDNAAPAADRKPFHDPPHWTARFAAEPIHVDGRLDEPVWRTCETYSLMLPADRSGKGQTLHEGGRVRLAWDKLHLYLAVDFDDRDVVAYGTKDQEFHFLKGDVAELFVKRPDLNEYWELYVTPAGRKSCIHFARSGDKPAFDPTCNLAVAARVDGTLNDPAHADRGWTAEMSVPAAALKFDDGQLAEGRQLRVLIGRYNYASGKSKLAGLSDDPELSSAPDLSRTSFHILGQYAHLKLVK